MSRRAGLQRGNGIGRDLCVIIVQRTAGNIRLRRKTRRHLVFRGHTHESTDARWQSEAGTCGSSSVTAACSRGGDASAVAPHIVGACLSWP